VHRDLRVVGTGLDAQVAAAAVRVERIAGEARQVGEGSGPAAGQAEPVTRIGMREQGGAEAD